MPRFEPFRALRYAPGTDLDAVIAPPYDVLSEADADALRARDPHNITHVDLPVGEPDRYAAAAQVLAAWVRDGVLVPDADPSFTLYRMQFVDAAGHSRDLVGVLGAIEVVDEGAGGVLPHERTTPKASTDRLDLTRATRANLSPVWGLALAPGLTEVLRDPGEPVGELDVDGVRHVVERVADPARVAAIRDAVAASEVLIADGHHRYGVARIYRDEVRDGGQPAPGAELTLAFVGELVAEQLSVEAIHRVYEGVSGEQLRDELARSFQLEPTDAPGPKTLDDMERTGSLVLVLADGTWRLTPKPGAFDGVRSLDGAWLEHALEGVPAQVSYQHGLDETVGLVQQGAVAGAVLIRPVSLAEIERTAREGIVMPPKSTFFTPKLRTGFVVRDLTEPVE